MGAKILFVEDDEALAMGTSYVLESEPLADIHCALLRQAQAREQQDNRCRTYTAQEVPSTLHHRGTQRTLCG